jgi:hypothetical protein
MSLHGKKRHVKKKEKGDVVTRFWYTLKKLHPLSWPSLLFPQLLNMICFN